jgi:hypothetical protein
MLDPVVSGTDQDVPNHKQSSIFQQCCCNAYLINDLGGSSRTMKWALRACVGAIVSVRMYSHAIVYFYIRTSENLVNVGSSRHKLPRHLQFCVGDTDPSGQNWSDTSCRADMSRHLGDIST